MNERNLKPWKKGQSGNPGGVSKARMGYRKALEEAVTTEDFTEVVKVLIEQALAGKAWAVKEFLDLTLGKDFTLNIETSEGCNSLTEALDLLEAELKL